MTGRLQIRNYDGKDGNKHYVTEIIANNVEFIEKKSESANRNVAPQGAAPAAGGAGAPIGTDVPFDEEIPF